MSIQRTLRIRGEHWDAIEKKAWELSIKENRVIKPTDVANAIISKWTAEITAKDVEEEKSKW